jgi:hypothetical protein
MVLMKHVPLHLEVVPFPQRNLGYIHIPLTTFRRIIYYSIGLKLLSLAPLSSLSTPSLTQPSGVHAPILFLRGRSIRSDVVYIKHINIYLYKKTSSKPLSSRLSGLKVHKPLAYNTWLTILQNIFTIRNYNWARPWGITQRGTYHMSLYIMPVITSRRSKTHQMQ